MEPARARTGWRTPQSNLRTFVLFVENRTPKKSLYTQPVYWSNQTARFIDLQFSLLFNRDDNKYQTFFGRTQFEMIYITVDGEERRHYLFKLINDSYQWIHYQVLPGLANALQKEESQVTVNLLKRCKNSHAGREPHAYWKCQARKSFHWCTFVVSNDAAKVQEGWCLTCGLSLRRILYKWLNSCVSDWVGEPNKYEQEAKTVLTHYWKCRQDK